MKELRFRTIAEKSDGMLSLENVSLALLPNSKTAQGCFLDRSSWSEAGSGQCGSMQKNLEGSAGNTVVQWGSEESLHNYVAKRCSGVELSGSGFDAKVALEDGCRR